MRRPPPAAGVAYRTAQSWLAAWRCGDKAARSDMGGRKIPDDLVKLVEGLVLRKPPVPTTALRLGTQRTLLSGE